jgi:hypothetical protein
MHRIARLAILAAAITWSAGALAQQFDGKLPLYPHAKNMNDMPAAALSAGVPMVMETSDSVDTVDSWYRTNSAVCARTAQSGGVKYQCQTGSIMIYPHQGKTQIAFVPSMF